MYHMRILTENMILNLKGSIIPQVRIGHSGVASVPESHATSPPVRIGRPESGRDPTQSEDTSYCGVERNSRPRHADQDGVHAVRWLPGYGQT